MAPCQQHKPLGEGSNGHTAIKHVMKNIRRRIGDIRKNLARRKERQPETVLGLGMLFFLNPRRRKEN
jgi:hypothetical protein